MGSVLMEGNLLRDKAVCTIFDNEKIKRFVPDFVANIPFKEGFKETVAWFEEVPERMVVHTDNNKFMDIIINE